MLINPVLRASGNQGTQFSGNSQPVVRFEYSTGHLPPLADSLGVTTHAHGAVAKALTPQEFNMLKQGINHYGNFLTQNVDFKKQTPIFIYPGIYTPTGMAKLAVNKLSHDAKNGLTVEYRVDLPAIGTDDIGNPWLLVVVDKKFAQGPIQVTEAP